ncbi:MAG: hypothetical protein IJM81_01450 [Prevotella sp.]|nr:hypothetical protein [Prevotella sp.]
MNSLDNQKANESIGQVNAQFNDNIWNQISTWIKPCDNKSDVIEFFNEKAKKSYINGDVPYLLKCSKSRGLNNYKHSCSSRFFSGLNILIKKDGVMQEEELRNIGLAIVGNPKNVRALMLLGWDTLFVLCDCFVINKAGYYVVPKLCWKLSDFAYVSNI